MAVIDVTQMSAIEQPGCRAPEMSGHDCLANGGHTFPRPPPTNFLVYSTSRDHLFFLKDFVDENNSETLAAMLDDDITANTLHDDDGDDDGDEGVDDDNGSDNELTSSTSQFLYASETPAASTDRTSVTSSSVSANEQRPDRNH
jgi:hypothetical protein